ncbi:N,N-dimethylaniline monooxygenase [Malassezia pachydermatis]|uniref:Monooxygenase n=1 Tax=Malassezia pachydermatis TaxID=77020 RepID=A0A0M9VP99_9BASI|nr:monooxygenase [Malassezia pachydermatis]KOS14032.1 monooxygenase [Malassezia pachydermatis]
MDGYPTSLPNGLKLAQDPINLGGLKPEYHDIVCVGGGLSGVSLACKLKSKYKKVPDMVIIERLQGPAGTWEANTYPGCACDIPAPVYSFSFRQKSDWSGFFPQQTELREYVHTVVAEYGIGHLFLFNSVALESRYDNATGLWHVLSATFDPKDPHNASPKIRYFVSKLFISAVGGLSEPNKCDIPGHENFKGKIFHSARWDHSVDLKNKNVIVVGNGCSATQFVPIIAEEAKHVTQFVRSKHWYAPLPDSKLVKTWWWKWLLRNVPLFMWVQRIIIWLVLESHFTIVTKSWLGRQFRASWEKMCRDYISKQAPKKYHDLLLPKNNELMVGCRRRVLDNKYLPALHRENLELEPSKLVRIEEDAVVTADGRRLPADVIVMANGFSVKAAGSPMVTRGKDMTLREHDEKYGGGGVIAYRTVFVSGFPNMGMLVGPNAGTGHMSVIYTSEREQEMLMSVASHVLESAKPSEAAIAHLPGTPAPAGVTKVPTFDVKLKAELDEQHWIVKKMRSTVFPTCESWYRDPKSGRVTAVYPDWQWRFALRCWFPVWKDFEFTGLKGGAKHPATTIYQKIGCALGLGTVPYVDPSETPEIDRKSMSA